jgi:hypothetical protein
MCLQPSQGGAILRSFPANRKPLFHVEQWENRLAAAGSRHRFADAACLHHRARKMLFHVEQPRRLNFLDDVPPRHEREKSNLPCDGPV